VSELLARISPAGLRQLGDISSSAPAPSDKKEDGTNAVDRDLRTSLFEYLSKDTDLVKQLRELRNRQRLLERQLWDERSAITRVFQGEMDALSRKYSMTQGDEAHASSMQDEIERIEASHVAALDEHSREKIITKWSELLVEQQSQFRMASDNLSQYGFSDLENRTIATLVEEYIESQSIQ